MGPADRPPGATYANGTPCPPAGPPNPSSTTSDRAALDSHREEQEVTSGRADRIPFRCRFAAPRRAAASPWRTRITIRGMNRLWTIGHSNRTIEDFVALLRENGIEQAIDIRRFPASRKWPHFNAGSLVESLPAAGIAYVPMPGLGGRRSAVAGSPHVAWKNDAFRAYADFLDTTEAEAFIDRIAALAEAAPAAVFCAEAVPWRCHRNLVADRFVARGREVLDILGAASVRAHALPDFARREGTRVVYDRVAQPSLPLPSEE